MTGHRVRRRDRPARLFVLGCVVLIVALTLVAAWPW